MNLAPGGARYAGGLLLLALLLIFVSPIASLVSVGLALFVGWFYRDPDRQPPVDGIVSPADGRVSVIREAEREDGTVQLHVGVFMNVHDVHVNRAPLAGKVESIEHTPGAHRPAFSKDSDRNEQVCIDFGDYWVVLIAGAFARRITPYVERGETVDRGDRIGHIAFGSRADVRLPTRYEWADLAVEEGERVRAGETILARKRK